MPRVDEPTFTSILSDVSELRPVPGSLYITGVSVETRSEHTAAWEADCQDVTLARVTDLSSSTVTFLVEAEQLEVQLRSRTSIADFLEAKRSSAIYLDITGLSHRVWAPLLRCIRSRREPALCVYVEPGDYQFSQAPTEATIFDLSERIEGIEPLPGFVSFSATNDDAPLFVPLLGFEGARFAFMLEAVQPKREDIFPVIGVPGFRPEYPFHTYAGNRIQLWDTKSWGERTICSSELPVFFVPCLGRGGEGQPRPTYGSRANRHEASRSGSHLVLP